MSKIKVAVIFGGNSTEYEVSLKSAASVLENIDRDKYEIIMLGITRGGKWLRYNGDIEKIRNNTWHMDNCCYPAVISPCRDIKGIIEILPENSYLNIDIDVAFPVMHGKYGEDGTIQGLLEMAGIPYVGCGTLSSAICMDKDIAHTLAEANGIRVPHSMPLHRSYDEGKVHLFAEAYGFPIYVKPVKSGSSIGIVKANNEKELYSGIDNAFKYDDKVLLEENIPGFEVGCAVLGNDEIVLGDVDEVEITKGFFDYGEKYSLETSRIHLPARLDCTTIDEIKKTAAKLYKILECKGFARIDMFIKPDKEIVFNEVNTIPGFTSKSRYPSMLISTGMTYSKIIDNLIALAQMDN